MAEHWTQTEDYKRIKQADQALYDLSQYFNEAGREYVFRCVYALRIELGNVENRLIRHHEQDEREKLEAPRG